MSQPPPLPARSRGIESPPLAAAPMVVAPPIVDPFAPLDFDRFVPSQTIRRIDASRIADEDAFPRRSIHRLAAGIVAVALLQLIPLWNHWNLTTAPNWARWIAMLVLLQTAYAAWMAILPNRTTVRVVTIVLVVVATFYGIAFGITLIESQLNSSMLQLSEVRKHARLWCPTIMLLICGITYFAGRVAFRR